MVLGLIEPGFEPFGDGRRRSREVRTGGGMDAVLQNLHHASKHLTSAAENKAKGAEKAIEGFSWLSKGNQTRARAGMKKAETAYTKARDTYKRVLRAVGSGAESGEYCKSQMKEVDRRLLEIFVRWGGLEVRNKAWKRASPIVDRGLQIDPVHSELTELRNEIDENWIRRRASDITGARGRQRSN